MTSSAARSNWLAVALAATAVLLLYGNLFALLPAETRHGVMIYANLALTATALAAAYLLGLGRGEIGLVRGAIRRSAVHGSAAAVALALPAVALVIVAPLVTGEAVRYVEVTDLTAGELALSLTVRFPVGTALTEEVLFRGLLLGLWRRAAGVRAAIAASSLAFSLWHLVVAFGTVRDSALVAQPVVLVASYGGTLFALFAAGILLAVLRVRTGSVAGPFMVHWLTVALLRLAIWARA